MGAWVDFAWAGLVDGAPMMANPAEYHTLVYELFWNGNAPTQRQSADGKAGKPAMVPKRAMDDLAELMADIEKAKAEAQAE